MRHHHHHHHDHDHRQHDDHQHHDHRQDDHHGSSDRDRRDRRRRGPHGHGRGRQRARRGAIGAAVLAMLGERPMHGYELIGALTERSEGRWQPSPGSVYPALQRLEDRGLIRPIDGDDDKRRFELTEAGRERLDALRESGDDEPWNDQEQRPRGDLRRAVAELVGPARQIGRFGSAEQIAGAVVALRTATDSLYRILADGRRDDEAAADAGLDAPGSPADDAV